MQPNILWITSEDMNAFLGAYGDSLAITPNLDRLAQEGVRYTQAFATAPVCSPSRSCLITGVYATRIGTQHLRSEIEIPDEIHGFTYYLRQAGYYCTNRTKEDYNFTDNTIWDQSGPDAHWRHRKEGQPFFSVFNFETTHQSRIFGTDSVFEARFGSQLSEQVRHDPASMFIPPYHFDSPTVRKLWARYYDLVTIMDRQAGEIIHQLEEDGLLDETIIFYYADHGTGMPRSKRALYDSGLKIPLIVRAPERWREALDLAAGTVNDRLISFVDFAPTILRLTNLPIPAYCQGEPFIGANLPPKSYVFGHSDRVDEAYEVSRTVRTDSFRYIRNYLAHLPLIQPNFYTDQSEIMQELRRIRETATLTTAQESMWMPRRPHEELYRVDLDPHEVNNLASDPLYQEKLLQLRQAHRDWARRTYDSGLIHEIDMHAQAAGSTIYEMLENPTLFPIDTILAITDWMLANPGPDDLIPWLGHKNPVVRYWAVQVIRQMNLWNPTLEQAMANLLEDPAASVRMTAAAALCEHGLCASTTGAIGLTLLEGAPMERLMAARTYELHQDKFTQTPEFVRQYVQQNCPQEDWNQYYALYTCWALEEALKMQ